MAEQLASGVRVGIDLGDVRIGVARSDATGVLAVPVETIARGPGDADRIAQIVDEYEAVELLVGLPLRLTGEEGPAALKVREWVAAFTAAHPAIAVRLIDERLSTVSAASGLRAAGRNAKNSRNIIDQAAAVVIVQSFIDAQSR